MTDIQLLFAPENAAVAERVAVALEGDGYQPVLGEAPASAAIVIWTAASAASPAILAGARAALAMRVLVPVAIGKTPPPPSFEHLAPVDLAGWAGDRRDPRWRFIVDELELAVRRGAEIGASAPAAPAPPPPIESPALDEETLYASAPARPFDDRPRPHLPRAAMVAGAFLFVLAGIAASAFYVGLSRPSEAAADEYGDLKEKSAAPPKPIVALVRPDAQPFEDETADEIPAEPTKLQPRPAAQIAKASATAPADFKFGPILDAPETNDQAGSDLPAPTLKPQTMAARDGLVPEEMAAMATENIETETETEEEEIEDPIAQIAWEATRDAAAESTYFGNYFRECFNCPDMAAIAPGAFMMGAPSEEPGRETSEGPPTPVTIADRYAIAVKEVSVEDWRECVAAGACPAIGAPAKEGSDDRPIAGVSWNDAQAYAAWLSQRTGSTYRLPTEAEWEYAARAGTATAFSFGDAITPNDANYDGGHPYGGSTGIFRGRTLPAGSFAPNGFGLYDMHGNVAEWTADCWAPTHAGAPADGTARAGECSTRVVKGGAWNSAGAELRSANREMAGQDERARDTGFRLVRDLP